MDTGGGQWSEQQYQEACDKVSQWDKSYYSLNHSLVDDTTYDIWYRKLVEYEQKNPDKRATASPTQRIQEPVKKLGGYQHRVPMLSMANTYSMEELRQFDSKNQDKLKNPLGYCTEAKLDGLALSCIYNQGELHRAVTRGDGKRGEDVTAQAKAIYDIPLKIEYSGRVEIRGEVYLRKEFFNQINQERKDRGVQPFANVRNVASGTLKTLNPKTVAKRRLSFFAFALGSYQELACQTQEEVLTYLKQWGMTVNPTFKIHQDIEGVIQQCQYWYHQREQLPYEIDGVVVKINQLQYREILGATSKIPHWQIAYKFPAQASISTIRDIHYQVSRLGVLCPVAILDPVYVSGSMIQRATLHNEDFINQKEITVGCQVEIEKGGEVIPKVIRKVGEQGELKRKQIQNCPSCGQKVEYQSPYWLCKNRECPQRVQGEIEHFISKKGCDIEEIGPKAVQWLVQNSRIKSWIDLFKMGVPQWLEVEHFAEKSAHKACTEFRLAKEKCLSKWIYGFGIKLIGEHVARLIASQVGTLKGFLQLNRVDCDLMYGLGEQQKYQVESFLKDPIQRERVQRVITWVGNIGFHYQESTFGKSNRVQSIWVARSISTQERRRLQQSRDQGILVIRGEEKQIWKQLRYDQACLGYSGSRMIPRLRGSSIQLIGDWSVELHNELAKVWGISVQSEENQQTKSKKSFLITGKLELGTRKQWHDRIKQCGDLIATTVQSTEILVVGEKPGSKLKKAQNLGKEIWTEQQLEQYYQESSKINQE